MNNEKANMVQPYIIKLEENKVPIKFACSCTVCSHCIVLKIALHGSFFYRLEYILTQLWILLEL